MEAEEFPTSGPSLGTIFSAQGVTRGKMISFLASSERFSGSCDLGFWDVIFFFFFFLAIFSNRCRPRRLSAR